MTEAGKHASVIKVSDKGMRIEHPMGAVLILPGDRKILMINREMKSVMEMPAPENAGAAGEKTAATPPKFTKSGNKETISGLACEEWVTTDSSGKTVRFWVSPEGPDAKALASFSSNLQSLTKGAPASPVSMKEFALAGGRLGGFPIRTVAENVTNTVLSFSTAAIPAAEFDIPADYRIMAMPAMPPIPASMPTMPQGVSIPKDVQKALQQMQKSGMPGGLTPEQMKALRDAAKGMIPPPQE